MPSDVIKFEGRGLSRTFGHGDKLVRAVDNVDFKIRDREIVSIVGQSGCGKTVLAKLLLRLEKPTSGELSFNGKPISAEADAREHWRQVQAVFQDPFSAFNQFFTIRWMLDQSRKLLGAVDVEERMTTALEQVGLRPKDMLDKYPHQLSGGQRQRVMIARALMMHPTLLIADEATSMLDASLRANVLNVLVDLRDNSGLSVMFITHDIGQACYISDLVLVMKNGKLVESGTVDEVIFNPQQEYTQRLLADVPRLHDLSDA